MKKIILIFSLLVPVVFASAQDGKKFIKKANKSLLNYNMDQKANEGSLAEALEFIKKAENDKTTSSNVKFWLTKGNIYNTMGSNDALNLTLNKTHKIRYPDAGKNAYMAMTKALEVAEKKFQTKEAIKGLEEAENNLANESNYYLTNSNYEKAFSPLFELISISKLIKEKGGVSIFKSDAEFNQNKYAASFCAKQIGKDDLAIKLLNELIDAKYDNASIYSDAFSLLLKTDETKAIEVLNKGKELFPNEKEMLFAEINYYIQKNDYATLKEKLAEAIEKNPENASLYSALGNVYMSLFQDNYAAGKEKEAMGYFDDAKKYFEKSLELEPGNFNDQYNLGSLYYNHAVEINKKMNDLPLNAKAEYKTLKEKTENLFDVALPYFTKAESLNPNDLSTLIALKEILVRKNDFETSNKIKERMENVKAGNKNETSFFK